MATEPGTHDLWLENAALYAIGAMDADDRRTFEEHLRTCQQCLSEVASIRPVNVAMARAVPQVDPPFALRQQVLDAALGPASVSVRGSESSPSAPAPAPRAESSASWQALATAASIVLMAGFGAYAYSLHTRLTRIENELTTARAQADANRGEADAARSALNETEQQLAVLTAADSTRAALSGGTPAPNASGRADWSPSRGLVVTTANLPEVKPGRTYQVWLLGKGVPPVSAGLLRPDASGQATAVFANVPAGVQPTGVALSEEPENGSPEPGPTGNIYLVGQFALASTSK